MCVLRKRDEGHSVSRSDFYLQICGLSQCWDYSISFLKQIFSRWMKTRNIIRCRVTHTSQKIHGDIFIMSDFFNMVNEVVNCNHISPKKVMNFDQTNLYYDMVSPYNLHISGSKGIKVKTSFNTNR